ncbi:hypothetical protein Q8G35_16680 [Peribacillus simplex]|uniref:Uncharacterized protein n=2 Tax=Peribacillus TaxID=2675229 RepID=A0AA90PA69_9BACI|nr:MULTISPECIES: hypothetical protein [Peribacillus]MDP1419979.1 hypothetical protein [Peribacillus simplex]MDP1451864.1 hypothetical protein [Peribacillus frigoritolerans]
MTIILLLVIVLQHPLSGTLAGSGGLIGMPSLLSDRFTHSSPGYWFSQISQSSFSSFYILFKKKQLKRMPSS